jgi:hypothetical protein
MIYVMKTCHQCGTAITRKVHPRTARPFCGSACYGLWQRGKRFSEQGKPARPSRQCSLCEAPHFGKGFCRKHYLAVSYTKPAAPTKTTKKKNNCAQCGKGFIAYQANPKFCSVPCSAAFRKKPFILKKGYKKVLLPMHPRADGKGYVFEHIVIVEATIGRPLRPREEIHHKDFNRQNNSPRNLIVCADHAEHMRYHALPSHRKE